MFPGHQRQSKCSLFNIPICRLEILFYFVSKQGKGVSVVACVSVNDPFVMAAWGEQHKAAGKVWKRFILW